MALPLVALLTLEVVMRMSFEQWKAEVDAEMIRLSSMDSEGVDDWDYYTAYNNRVSPKVAAKRALNNACWSSGLPKMF
jgi:hypothetical protein